MLLAWALHRCAPCLRHAGHDLSVIQPRVAARCLLLQRTAWRRRHGSPGARGEPLLGAVIRVWSADAAWLWCTGSVETIVASGHGGHMPGALWHAFEHLMDLCMYMNPVHAACSRALLNLPGGPSIAEGLWVQDMVYLSQGLPAAWCAT